MSRRASFPLASRPGFLIRRLHQIHLSLFAEECAAFDVTPVQFSILSAVAAQPGLEQAALGREVGVDRATLANVVARLARRGLLRRVPGRADRRLKHVHPTASGRRLLARMETAARRAHDRTVAALPPRERARFVAALRRLVAETNDHGRAPLRISGV
ncbi:MarR family winged helix-turn-helix transcriptional regulator [Reyranella sp.]|uniref:MarR family winged helix-turn-helix transcriptional regulator n=1 Tax=Reyranella sp. TaxID=1929291 RepID=UPI003BABA437